MKKLFAVLLAVMMVMLMAASAVAEDGSIYWRQFNS